MSNIERVQARSVIVRPSGTTIAERRHSARTARALTVIEHTTLVRLAQVEADGVIATDKVHEIHHAAREGVTDYAMLYHYATAASGGDPVLLDELRLIKETARLGSAEVLADLVDTYCRESRR